VLKRFGVNPLNPGHFCEFRKVSSGYHQVKPFYSGRIVSKLMAKNTSLLSNNTAFEHKFHVDTNEKMTKWWPNTIPFRKKLYLFGQKQLGLKGNIEQKA
jgi:hypothetical protein